MKILDIDASDFPFVKVHAGLLAIVGVLVFIGTLLI